MKKAPAPGTNQGNESSLRSHTPDFECTASPAGPQISSPEGTPCPHLPCVDDRTLIALACVVASSRAFRSTLSLRDGSRRNSHNNPSRADAMTPSWTSGVVPARRPQVRIQSVFQCDERRNVTPGFTSNNTADRSVGDPGPGSNSPPRLTRLLDPIAQSPANCLHPLQVWWSPEDQHGVRPLTSLNETRYTRLTVARHAPTVWVRWGRPSGACSNGAYVHRPGDL